MKTSLRFARLVSPLLAGTVVFGSMVPARAAAQPTIKVLIVDGQNNHAWATTTPLLKKILEDSGRFTVDVSTSPPAAPVRPALPKSATPAQQAAQTVSMKAFAAAAADYQSRSGAAWAAWRPNFTGYAVVISNYNGDLWPEAVRATFVDFVNAGGGFVSYHAANNAFPEWPEYNEMIGLGGWGGRTEKAGPYLRWRENKWIRDTSPGPGGGHGPQHEFLVETRDPAHAIMRGLPPAWMHPKDELYHGLRGPAKNLTVLASAMSDRTHEHEPLLLAVGYGRGRVFHTALGHGVEAVSGLGFQTTLLRGTEWAATGRVTLPAPKTIDLPSDRAAVRAVQLR